MIAHENWRIRAGFNRFPFLQLHEHVPAAGIWAGSKPKPREGEREVPRVENVRKFPAKFVER